MNKRQQQYKAQAEARADILWARYHQNGGRITVVEVKELFNQKACELYPRFARWGVKPPPLADSHEAKRQGKADALWALCNELGREWVTTKELAEVWQTETKHALNLYRNMQKYHHVLPQLRYKSRQRHKPPPGPPGKRDDIHTRYPTGFNYWRKVPLPNGMAIYSIK